MSRQRAELATKVIETACKLTSQGLTAGHTGNVSARVKGGMIITPTGMPYDGLSSDEIVFVSNDGKWDKKGIAPSSEWQFHLSAYQANRDVKALVHCHSNFATTLACAGHEIPPFHYMVAAAGGHQIPLVPYAIFGSKKLSDNVLGAFKTHKACLLAHHGQLAGEKNLEKALELAEIIEDLSRQYWAVLQLGAPTLLSARQMDDVLKKFASYGQQPNLR